MQSKSKMHWFVMLAMCGLAVSAVGLPVMSNGVFIQPIADDLGVYRGSIAVHNTMTMLTKAIMSLYVPVLMQKFSFKKIIIIGVLLAGVSNYLLGWTNIIWQFNVLGTIRGIGTGLLAWVPVTIVINEWFEEKHGLVTSIVLSFSSITGAIFSPIFTFLIVLLGWAVVYRIMGILIILFALPAIVLNFSVNPEDSGYFPYGHKDVDDTEPKQSEEIISNTNKAKEISLLSFFLLTTFALLQTMLTSIPQHFPGFSENIGAPLSVGAAMLSITMISSIGFKLLMGYISDFIGAVKSTIGMLFLITIGSTLILISNQSISLFVGAFLFGAVYTMPTVSTTLLTKEFFGRHQFPRVYPIIAFSTSIGSAISLSLIGFIFDFTGTYLLVFILAVVINLLNIGILRYIKVKTTKYKIADPLHNSEKL